MISASILQHQARAMIEQEDIMFNPPAVDSYEYSEASGIVYLS